MAVILLLPLFMVLIIRTPSVQTFIVNKVTSRISERINTTISIGSIHFSFFNRIVASDILILDTNADTLLYTKELTAGIRRLGINGSPVRFTSITLREPVFKIIREDPEQTNLRWYLDLLKNDEKGEQDKTFSLTANQITINKGRFHMISPADETTSEKDGISFKNLEVIDINAIIEDFSVNGKNVGLSVYRLSFFERSGFAAMKMAFKLNVSKNEMEFSGVNIDTPGSIINSDLIRFQYEKEKAFRNFAEDVRMTILLDNTVLSQKDLIFFAPALTHDPGPVNISGTVSGTLSELRGRDISIIAGKSTSLHCSFDLSGLPDIDNTYIFVDISDLETTTSELATLGFFEPEQISKEIESSIGRAQFKGTFSGFLTDFVTYGQLQTESGNLLTDISLRPGQENRFQFGGTIEGHSIDVGSLTGEHELFGESSFNLLLEGEYRSANEFSASLAGTIDSSVLNGYTYREIKLNGDFNEKRWNGSVEVRDDKLHLDFAGLIDFQQQLPNFDFSLDIPYAWLYDLNFEETDSSAFINTFITAKFAGDSPDNVSGSLVIHNAGFIRFGNSFNIEDGLIRVNHENETPHITVNSNVLDANLTGQYDFAGLPADILLIAGKLIPSYYNVPEEFTGSKNKFNLNILLHNTEELNRFLQTGLNVAEGTEIEIDFISDEMVRATVVSDHVDFKNNIFEDFALETEATPSNGFLTMESTSFTLAGVPNLNQFRASIKATTDTINTTISWDDEEEVITNKGDVFIKTIFSLTDSARNVTASVGESEVFVRNEKWIINEADISHYKGVTSIGNLLVNSRDNFYRVSGKISESPHDSLVVEINGIDLAALNKIIDERGNDNEESAVDLSLGGILSGKVVLKSILANPMVETEDFLVEEFRMIEHRYGNIMVNSQYDSNKELATIRLNNELDGVSSILIEGIYDPKIKEMDISLLANSLPIDILNPLLSSFASGINGYATGKIEIKGKTNQPEVTGALFVNNATLTIDYLNAPFFFSDSIIFTSRAIILNNIDATDGQGNRIRTDGYIRHQYFRDYEINLTMNPNRAMVLNTTQGDNDIFYGQAFATGLVNIRGYGGNLSFDISARTERNSRVYVPLSSAQSIGDYPFIVFTESELPDEEENPRENGNDKGASISLNLDLDVTPDTEVQLVIDSRTGDIIRGRGSGRLNMSLRPNEDFRINGDYIISSGDYMFTLGNILNKRFTIEEGSSITWSGDITEAVIDIKATHRVDASLHEILQDERFKERIPVDCVLLLTENLVTPKVEFDINLPTADEQTRSYLRNAINSQEEMSLQFVYLLIMRQFYPDPSYLSGTAFPSSSVIGSSAIGSGFEMVFNQMANWISQISNDFDVGFTYRPGNEISPDELELALSTQILNDRVIINGNIDVAGNQHSAATNTLSGDFDIEFKITEKVRFNFFNRSNDNLLYETSPYTQGIGLMLKHDFDRFRFGLFNQSEKSKAKKEEDPVPVDIE